MSAVKWTVDWREGWGNLPPEYVQKLMCLCYVELCHNWQSSKTVYMVGLNFLKCVDGMVLIDIHCFTVCTLLSLSLCIYVCLSCHLLVIQRWHTFTVYMTFANVFSQRCLLKFVYIMTIAVHVVYTGSFNSQIDLICSAIVCVVLLNSSQWWANPKSDMIVLFSII